MTFPIGRAQDAKIMPKDGGDEYVVGVVLSDVDQDQYVDDGVAPSRDVRRFVMRVTPRTLRVRASDVIEYMDTRYEIESVTTDILSYRIDAIASSLG